MEKIKCPHCHRKQIYNEECQYCKGKINSTDPHPFLDRELRLAMYVDNEKQISKISNMILLEDGNDLYAQYAKAYVNLNDSIQMDAFLKKANPDEYILNHMINHLDRIGEKRIKSYISRFPLDRKGYLEQALSNDIIETNINEELFFDFEFRKPVERNDYLITSIMRIVFGVILYLIVYFIGTVKFPEGTKHFATVLLYIIPTIFIASSLTKIIYRKKNLLLSIILFILVLVLSTYIVVYPYTNGFFDHIGKVGLAPVALVDYIVSGVIS
jgi:hypothetical protein